MPTMQCVTWTIAVCQGARKGCAAFMEMPPREVTRESTRDMVSTKADVVEAIVEGAAHLVAVAAAARDEVFRETVEAAERRS